MIINRAGGKPYFSVAVLPDATEPTLALFARHAHAHVTGTWDNYADGPQISVEETSWGLKVAAVRPKSGKRLVAYYGMPNMAPGGW